MSTATGREAGERLPLLVALLVAVALLLGCGSPGGDGNGGEAAGERSDIGAFERTNGVSAGAAGPASEGEVEGGEAAGGEAAASTVLFIGTSLTAGLGVPEAQSFPLRIEERIAEADLPFRVVNAGVSGETSAGALRRIDWLLRQPVAAVVLETGANDMLRGVDPATTESNIQAIIDRLQAEHPDVPVVLAGMMALPNMGQAYGREFEAIYPRLAERNDLAYIPFLLEGVGGERELNQNDGIHPNADGHRVITETVWQVLEPVLRSLHAEPEQRADAP